MNNPFAYTRGPRDAKVILCGEAWGKNEEMQGLPFVGESGHELTSMLIEAGFNPTEILYTNVVDARPYDNDIENFFHGRREGKMLGREFLGHYPNDILREGITKLYSLVDAVKPRLIIPVGNTPLWALGGKTAKAKSRGIAPTGITKWRSSELSTVDNRWPGTKLVPTYHPAAILRQWSWRHITVQDLRRAFRESQYDGLVRPEWQFIVRPSFSQACEVLDFLLDLADRTGPGETLDLEGDIETRRGRIACIGIGWSLSEAICIPFQSSETIEGYWTLDEEVEIVLRLRRLQCHSKVRMTYQNAVFDFTHHAKDWGYLPNLGHDTLVMQHTVWPGLPKALYFLASMYCEHYWFWKDEGEPDDDKEWNPHDMPEDKLWYYNCQDLVRTRESRLELWQLIDKFDLWEQYEMQLQMVHISLDMSLRGTRIDRSRRSMLSRDLEKAFNERVDWINFVLDHEMNVRSHPQMTTLFYEDLSCKPIRDRVSKSLTCNDAALKEISEKYPLLRPLVQTIQEIRSIAIFKKNFVDAQLSEDNRIRCSFNIAGTETYRWSSSKDPYNHGANLQTIPKGTEKD